MTKTETVVDGVTTHTAFHEGNLEVMLGPDVLYIRTDLEFVSGAQVRVPHKYIPVLVDMLAKLGLLP